MSCHGAGSGHLRHSLRLRDGGGCLRANCEIILVGADLNNEVSKGGDLFGSEQVNRNVCDKHEGEGRQQADLRVDESSLAAASAELSGRWVRIPDNNSPSSA